jgi:hypothetical protein
VREIISKDMQLSLEAHMPNTANRRNLKALMDMLSDGHADITAKAVKANERLMEADNPTKGKDEAGQRKFSGFALKGADRELGDLLELLNSQERRCVRVREEITEIKRNLKVI